MLMGIRLSSGKVIEFSNGDRTKADQAARRRSPMSVGGGRDPSLRWPWLYDILRSKGYDKEAAARISNARVWARKKGRLNVLNYRQADKMRTVKAAVKKAGY